ncbi:MAG: SIMPL domain-containing protein [Bacillota bacterium]|jgi:hypothetical protein|nr:SIMPL domain-containing protein [Bacillota bacterium]MDD3298219.1 SIMPL domain-containing protein [Bacillota bacterium]MDD3850668.1 SIMPL domain-containing protein [Bacillota bacterium]MDD4707781.1 SIMPL domain-containing protein [Bacillota bacterium]
MTGKGSKVASYLLVVTVLAFALYIAGDVFSQNAAAAQDTKENTISVNGKGIIKVKPDIAYIRVGVETRGTDAKKAQQENARIMDGVTAKLKSLGIGDDDIKTVTYRLYPLERYDEKTKKSYVYEYRVNNMVEVVVRDIDSTGAVIDGVSAVGSNKISSIRFGIEDTDKYYNQALNAAVVTASGKAEAIAKGLGVTLKGAVNVHEVSSGGPLVVRDTVGLAKTMESADMAATPISTGELEISAMVSVEYNY